MGRAPTSAEMRAIASSMMDRGVDGGYVTMTSLSGAWASWAPWTPAAAMRARDVKKGTIFMMKYSLSSPGNDICFSEFWIQWMMSAG